VGRKILLTHSLTHSSSTKIGRVHLYLKLAHFCGMKSVKYSSHVCFLNVCIQFRGLSHWSTRPLVGQKGSSIRNVKTTDQHLCYWLVLCMTYRALWWMGTSKLVFLLDGQNLCISTGSGFFIFFQYLYGRLFLPFLAFWDFNRPLWVRIKQKIDSRSSLWGVLNEIHHPVNAPSPFSRFEVLVGGCEPTILGVGDGTVRNSVRQFL